MKKVIHIGDFKWEDSANGVHKTIKGLAEHLSKLNYDIEIWDFSCKVKNIEKYNFYDNLKHVKLPKYKFDLLNIFLLPPITKKYIQNNITDEVIFHMHSVFIPENIYISKLKSPFIITPNGGYQKSVFNKSNTIIKNIWFNLFEKKMLSEAKYIHSVSIPEENRIKELGFKNVFYLPNGINLCGNQVGNDFGDYFLFLGRMDIYHKGIDLLLNGYYQAVQEKADIRNLVLCGPDSQNGYEFIKNFINKNKLNDKVFLFKPKYGEDKAVLFKKAHSFVHTSRYEGLPFAIIEALSYSIPTIITPGTNFGNYLKNYEFGIITNDDVKSIKKAILYMDNLTLSKYLYYKSMAKEIICKELLWENIVGKMIKYYENSDQ